MDSNINDEESDGVPDDFFDDFSNAEFMEGLNIIDSWEPPASLMNDIIVIDDIDDNKKAASIPKLSDGSGNKDESRIDGEMDMYRNRSRSRLDDNKSPAKHDDRSSFRRFDAPVRRYKDSSDRLSKSPRNEPKKYSSSYYDRISTSRFSPESYRTKSPLRRKRSRDIFFRSRRSTSKELRRLARRSKSRENKLNRNRSRTRSRSRFRSRSRSRSRYADRNRRRKSSYERNSKGHYSKRSINSFSISPDADRYKNRHPPNGKSFSNNRDNSSRKPLFLPLEFSESVQQQSTYNYDQNQYKPENNYMQQNFPFTGVPYPGQPYPNNPLPNMSFPYVDQSAQNQNYNPNANPNYIPNMNLNFNPCPNITVPVASQSTSYFPSLPSSSDVKNNENRKKVQEESKRSEVEQEVKKLFAEKKISLSEFLTMSAKRLDPTKGSDSVESKVKILSRCNEALAYLKDLEEFPKQFIYNEKRYADFQRVFNPALKYCSPLRKTKVVRFRFTTAFDQTVKNKSQRIRCYIKALNIKFDHFKNYCTTTPLKEDNPTPEKALSTSTRLPGKYHKFIQTEPTECNACKERSGIKTKDVECQVNFEDFAEFCSSLFERMERERFLANSQQVQTFNNPMLINDTRFTDVASSSADQMFSMRTNASEGNVDNMNCMDFTNDEVDLRKAFAFTNAATSPNKKRKRKRGPKKRAWMRNATCNSK